MSFATSSYPKSKLMRWLCLSLAAACLMLPAYSRHTVAAAAENYPMAAALPVNPVRPYYYWGYETCGYQINLVGACRSTYRQPRTTDGRLMYVRDPWGYDIRNCTSYIAWRLFAEFGVQLPPLGHAAQWDDNARARGLAVDIGGPEPGDIAVWDGDLGHVAYVEGVNPDGSVNISEYNFQGRGELGRRSAVRANHYIDTNGEGNYGPAAAERYENRILGYDNSTYYVAQDKRHKFPNTSVQNCVAVRRGAGGTLDVNRATWESYTPGAEAYCPYETENGLYFVQESGDPTVWYIEPGGIKRHVGSLCVGDPYTTRWKQFRVWTVPRGETAGLHKGQDYWSSGQGCDALAKVWLS